MIVHGIHHYHLRPPGSKHRAEGETGYVLVVFMLFAALLLVGLSTILPKIVFEGQREREEELVFRGLQYRHAIQLFVRKFGRYPNSVEELEKTNGIRFLRKPYKDPVTKDGKWRLIHIGPGGVLVDSLTNPLRPPGTTSSTGPGSNPAQPGATGLQSSPGFSPAGGQLQPGAGQSSGQPTFGGTFPGSGPSGSGTQPGTTQNIGQPSTPGISSAVGPPLPGNAGDQPIDPALSPSANPGANPLVQPRASAQAQQTAGGAPPSGTPDASSSPSTSQTSFSSTPFSTQQSTGSLVFGSGAIAGFASQSKLQSIRIWNGYDEYDKWEFIYDFRQDPTALAKLGATQPQTPTQPQPGALSQPATQPQVPSGFPGGLSPLPGQAPGGLSGQPGPTSPQSPVSPFPGGFPPRPQR